MNLSLYLDKLKKRKNANLTKKLIIVLFFSFYIVAVFYLFFYNLGTAPFDNWDEAWYADVTRNILEKKEFIVLYWNNDVWLDKPPLYMWLSAFISWIIGMSEFSMRIVSAISGAILVILVTIYSYKNYGLVPSFLAFSSIALNNIFIWRARSGNLDIFLSLLIFLTFLVLLSKDKYKYVILGFLFAAIYLTKTSIVFYPLSIFVLHEALFNRDKWKTLYKEYIKLALITILIPAIWLFLGYLKIGLDFPSYFLLSSDQNVSRISLDTFNTNYIFHAYYSLQRRFFYVLLIGLFFAFTKIKESKFLVLILYSTMLLVLLSFTERDNNWYLIPSIPFWAILIAYGTHRVIKIFRNNIFIILLILGLSFYVSYRTLTINIIPILNNASVVKLAESARELNKLTEKDDIVARLDHLYPTTIFYTDRRVVVSLSDVDYTNDYWMSRDDLIEAIEKNKISWVMGTNDDITAFTNEIKNKEIIIIKSNDEEAILHIIDKEK